MNKYSVFTRTYGWRHYLTHPWKIFTNLWRNCRMALQRARYGWCRTDAWDFYDWFLHIAPDMLRQIANDGDGYPGREPFETPEKWRDWLCATADKLETGIEEWQDAHNEYYNAYMDKLINDPWLVNEVDEEGKTHHILAPQTELDRKYFARAQELAAEGENNVREAMTEMGLYFYYIWD